MWYTVEYTESQQEQTCLMSITLVCWHNLHMLMHDAKWTIVACSLCVCGCALNVSSNGCVCAAPVIRFLIDFSVCVFQVEKRLDLVKQVTHSTHKKLTACLQGQQGTDMEKRSVKSPSVSQWSSHLTCSFKGPTIWWDCFYLSGPSLACEILSANITPQEPLGVPGSSF